MICRGHVFSYEIHWEGGGGFFDVCGFGNFWENIEILDFFILNFFEIMENIAKLPVIICRVKGNQRACVPSGHFHFISLKQMFSIGAPWIHTYKAMYLCTI